MRMLNKWKQSLTGGADINIRDADVAACIAKLTAEARYHWHTLNTAGEPGCRDYLWPDLRGTTDSYMVSAAYNRIRSMALAYSLKQSELEHNERLRSDIVSALDWMNEHRYREGLEPYSNWWHWEIGAPLALNDAVVLMADQLTEKQIAEYMKAIDYYSNDLRTSKHTAANRIWVCLVQAIRSIIRKDWERLSEVRDAIRPVFAYVKEGDGFYRDGSFIQHGRFAYTGSYGKSMLGDLSKLLGLLGGTEWEVTDPGVNHVYDWIFEAFAPIMVNGSLMDMTRGREISRYYSQEHEAGHGVIDAVLRLSMIAPAPIAPRLQQLVKMWIASDTYRIYVEHAPLELIMPAKQLLKNADIPSAGDRSLFKIYGCMDRAVHHRSGFAFGISMFSERVRNYEVTNGENLKGWYTAHGNTFLYNADLGQFSDAFWPTVNAYRLPGTTVTSSPLPDAYGWHRVSSKSWIGGAALLNQYGAVGMEPEDYRLEPEDYRLEQEEEPLTALKSWFLFDEEVVAIGSDIRAQGRYSVETIVENRKLNDNGNNDFMIDGVIQPNEPGWKGEWKSVSWMHLKGHKDGDDIGTFFPGRSAIHALREVRVGRWSDLTKGENLPEGATGPLSRSYLTVWHDHGVRPESQAYAYVLLPGASAQQTASYASSPQIDIIERSSEAHAVYHKGLQLLCINYWKDGSKTVGEVTCHQKASLLLKESADVLDLAVADPTHRNDAVLEIEMRRTACRVISADDGVTVEQLHPFIRIRVRVEGAMGKTFQVKLGKR